MKLAFFDDFNLGVVKDGAVVDVSDAVSGVNHTSPQDLINRVIENFDDLKEALQQAADSGAGVPLNSVRLRPPLPQARQRRRHGRQLHGGRHQRRARPHKRFPQVALTPSSAPATP